MGIDVVSVVRMLCRERRVVVLRPQAAVSGQIVSKLFWLSETNQCGTMIVFSLQSRKLDVDITSQHISMELLFWSETVILDMDIPG